MNNADHQRQHATWMKAGLERHGWNVEFAPRGRIVEADLLVTWGIKQQTVIAHAKQRGIPVLVMERGHLQDRMMFTSVGLNGLGRRGTYPRADDGGGRWRKHFGHGEKPWKVGGEHALVCGQVLGDASLWGCDFRRWAQTVTDQLAAIGMPVIYRPHPLSQRRGDVWCPTGARMSTATLEQDLSAAAMVVTFNSTVGVEAVLAGLPTVTCDPGSMAWDVTTHSIDDTSVRPDRTAWMHDLAWTS